MDPQEQVRRFLSSGPFAVVGASRDRNKYGNKVLQSYLRNGRVVYAVNPATTSVEGQPCFPDLASLPEPVRSVSVITPPDVTERIVENLPACGAEWVWMQPGAESPAAVQRARQLGVAVIAGGPCVLVALGR